jgi:Rieske Fe-S protein
MDVTSDNPVSTTRRTAVALAGASGLAAVLAACGSEKAGGGSVSTGNGSGSSGNGSSGGKATALAKTSEIPEGGGKIFAAQKVVVTQPKAGEFKCFTAICTHLGCTVSEVKDGTIDCPCHGSKYRITDGSVAGGPAPSPLAPEKITVANGEVTLD